MISRRGLFGAFAGFSVAPLVAVPDAAAIKFPQEGVELASMKWFLKNRGRGLLRGLESGHDIFITHKVLTKEILKLDNRQMVNLRYLVSWKMETRGPVAVEIRGVRPWTREEREQEVQKWIERQDGLA